MAEIGKKQPVCLPETLVHPFPFVADKSCRVLILGSFPSVKSRENGFFYGHPQNRFWSMLAMIYHEDAPKDIPQKKSLLLRHHIALWDAAMSCSIEGSSDSSLKNAVPTDLSPIFSLCSIQKVLCNGSAAYSLYQKYQFTVTGVEGLRMPSTSPANAAWSLARLCAAWAEALG